MTELTWMKAGMDREHVFVAWRLGFRAPCWDVPGSSVYWAGTREQLKHIFVGQHGLLYNAVSRRHLAQPGISVVETNSKSCPIPGLERVPLVYNAGKKYIWMSIFLKTGWEVVPATGMLDWESIIFLPANPWGNMPLGPPWPLGGLCSSRLNV